MMAWIRNLSLKIKLIFLLVLLTGGMLIVYGAMALKDFEKDKIAYVLDSSLAHARSSAMQIRAETGYVVEKVKFFMRGYNDVENAFHPYSSQIFSQESNFHSCASFYQDSATKTYMMGPQLKSTRATDADMLEIADVAKKIIPHIIENEMSIYKLPQGSRWVLGLRFDRAGQPPLVVISTLEKGHFIGLFQGAQMQDTYLVSTRGEVIISPVMSTYSITPNDLQKAVSETIQKTRSTEGTYQYQAPVKKAESWLVAMSDIGFGQLRIMSFIPRKAALEAVKLLMVKSALFLAFLLCVTVFLSVVSSTTLTSSLKKLLFATSEIARGNFAIQVNISGRDEIGSLAGGFNKMASEIQRLMKDTAEKARMESELNTARLVQSTLFPKGSLVEGDIEIRGYYEPASECSGDWWYYQKVGDRTLFCIADATGHGVPAALLTAAARSAASAIESFADMSIAEMMSIFNKAIYNTANGQVMMTLFLGSYHHATGEITYANASHEPPYLLPSKEKISKKDIVLLNEVSGSRLGENPATIYQEARVQMSSGDRIMLYTDGVTDLKNKKGDMWGERQLIKLLLAESNSKANLQHTMDKISTELKDFRKNHGLHDDVTYFMIERNRAA